MSNRHIERLFNKAVFSVAVAIATLYGGAKHFPVQNAGADAGISLVQITTDYDRTNDVTAVEVSFTGINVTTATPVSVRNGQNESWRELVKIGAAVTIDLQTNMLTFAASGNVATNRFWWVGTETPAVIVETAGIEITYFAASSKSVQIAWSCDDARASEFAIQRRRKGSANWETVGVTTLFSFMYSGFTVGQTWEWRVTATYTGGEE